MFNFKFLVVCCTCEFYLKINHKFISSRKLSPCKLVLKGEFNTWVSNKFLQ